ncbi:hypothetical protein NDU88_009804 [Pleurodeles waltl]|uniref:Uncharacterized protein n=1 Tax=Pleurodeles waltl TaxID=8319 RepID=A0AAV7QSM0_PLEWA|nr:hypothetical protein NDU88_009804 [Pleurodeles waltl]
MSQHHHAWPGQLHSSIRRALPCGSRSAQLELDLTRRTSQGPPFCQAARRLAQVDCASSVLPPGPHSLQRFQPPPLCPLSLDPRLPLSYSPLPAGFQSEGKQKKGEGGCHRLFSFHPPRCPVLGPGVRSDSRSPRSHCGASASLLSVSPCVPGAGGILRSPDPRGEPAAAARRRCPRPTQCSPTLPEAQTRPTASDTSSMSQHHHAWPRQLLSSIRPALPCGSRSAQLELDLTRRTSQGPPFCQAACRVAQVDCASRFV